MQKTTKANEGFCHKWRLKCKSAVMVFSTEGCMNLFSLE